MGLWGMKDSYTDVTLICKDGKVNSHRIILAAASDYFKTALGVGNDVTMPDVTCSVLLVILEFIYQRKVKVSANDLGKFLLQAISLGIKGLNAFKGEEEEASQLIVKSDPKFENPNSSYKMLLNGLTSEVRDDASNAVSIEGNLSKNQHIKNEQLVDNSTFSDTYQQEDCSSNQDVSLKSLGCQKEDGKYAHPKINPLTTIDLLLLDEIVDMYINPTEDMNRSDKCDEGKTDSKARSDTMDNPIRTDGEDNKTNNGTRSDKGDDESKTDSRTRSGNYEKDRPDKGVEDILLQYDTFQQSAVTAESEPDSLKTAENDENGTS